MKANKRIRDLRRRSTSCILLKEYVQAHKNGRRLSYFTTSPAPDNDLVRVPKSKGK